MNSILAESATVATGVVSLDQYGIVELLIPELHDLICGGADPTGPNAQCVNKGCGAEINSTCYGSNYACIATFNIECGSNIYCSPA